METKRSASNCRWAVPTLFQPSPIWIEAWDCPWTCVRDTPSRRLKTTEECGTCVRWEARAEHTPPSE
jgi:hypothetical protein